MTVYSPSLRLWEGTPGDPAIKNVWGTALNTNDNLIEAAILGIASVSINGLTSYTLTTANGAADQARPMLQQYTGALTANCTVTMPNVLKFGYAQNLTTGGFNVILTAGAGTTVSIPPDGRLYWYAAGGDTNVTVPAVGYGGLTITDLGTFTPGTLTVSAVNSGAGVTIKMIGNGATTPSKTLRVGGGTFQIINDANTAEILILDDSGGLTAPSITATVALNGQAVASASTLTAQGAISGQSTLTTLGTIETGQGFIPGTGFASKVGVSGGLTGNMFNLDWTGAGVALWIDNTNLGIISTTSDRRAKKDIKPRTRGFLARNAALQVVTYKFAKVGIFKASHKSHVGFISQDVQKIIPSAVNGAPDAINEDGTPQTQSINPIPLIAENTGSIQELHAMVASLRARIETLEKER